MVNVSDGVTIKAAESALGVQHEVHGVGWSGVPGFAGGSVEIHSHYGPVVDVVIHFNFLVEDLQRNHGVGIAHDAVE